MFQLMPSSAPPPKVERKGIKGFFLNVYHDPFKWSLVKSIGLFIIGVKTANDFDGFDVLNPGA